MKVKPPTRCACDLCIIIIILVQIFCVNKITMIVNPSKNMCLVSFFFYIFCQQFQLSIRILHSISYTALWPSTHTKKFIKQNEKFLGHKETVCAHIICACASTATAAIKYTHTQNAWWQWKYFEMLKEIHIYVGWGWACGALCDTTREKKSGLRACTHQIFLDKIHCNSQFTSEF